MRWLGYAWDAAAWFFLLSVASAPFVALVVKCKARGKRKFVDLPMQRLGPPPTRPHVVDHRWDAM
jgi:hypothetical protein